MGDLQQLLLMMAIIYGINLMPALVPPTWAVLAFFNVKYDIPIPLLVVFGAISAAAGRLTLGTFAKHQRHRFSESRLKELDTLRLLAEQRRGASFGALMLFAISPLSSASLFIAAGLAGLRLLPVTVAFFCGRLVSYTIYVSASSVAADNIEKLLEGGFSSPWVIVLQIAALLMVVGLALAPWSKWLARWLPADPQRSDRPAS